MVSAAVGVPVISGVPSNGVSISSGVLFLSGFPDVPVVSCAGEGPAALVVLTAVEIPESHAVATMLPLSSLSC